MDIVTLHSVWKVCTNNVSISASTNAGQGGFTSAVDVAGKMLL